jgi:hypothetical protein
MQKIDSRLTISTYAVFLTQWLIVSDWVQYCFQNLNNDERSVRSLHASGNTSAARAQLIPDTRTRE